MFWPLKSIKKNGLKSALGLSRDKAGGSALDRPRREGFTLLETLIYLALFSILMGGLVVVSYNIIESSGRSQGQIALQEEGNFLLGKLQWALSDASSITVLPTKLVVNKYNFSENPLTFDLNGSSIRLQSGITPAVPLNNSAVDVISLKFSDIPSSNGLPEGVAYSFALQTRSASGSLLARNFTSTHYLH